MAFTYQTDDRNISGGNLQDAKTLIQNCEYEVYSMFGIKRDKTSIHSVYKIGRIIGDGNFAIVRECRNRKTQKPYALKVINKAKVKGKEHMIENEILILRRISHPNIVKLHEEFETPKEIYLVMELVTGGDLFDAIVANTRFSEPESAYMVRDLASAVDYLHQLQIVHRDIKPENLLVVNRPDGRKSIKLADFGLSIEVKSPMFLVCGTPTYVAPEILDESGYGLKVDVWAIGVICYILLCGFPPFRSSNHDQEELFDKILRGDFEYLSPFWDDVSDGPRDLIDRLLLVDASERYDAVEILDHFWIKKWTEPASEKLHRELSQAEEANQYNRKRLKGIALSIQAVISLLHLVRSRNKPKVLNTSISDNKVTIKPTISRIPRPKPSAGLHIAEIRKSITAPIRRPVGYTRSTPASSKTSNNSKAPEYPLKKGYLKREEGFKEGSTQSKQRTPVNKKISYVMRSDSPASIRRNVKSKHGLTYKRPVQSVIDLRGELNTSSSNLHRPSSAHSVGATARRSVSLSKSKNNEKSIQQRPKSATTRKIEKTSNDETHLAKAMPLKNMQDKEESESITLRLKAKVNRPRPRSMIETKITSKSIDEFLQMNDLDPVVEYNSVKLDRSDSNKSGSSESTKEDTKKVIRRPRTINLLLKDGLNSKPCSQVTTPITPVEQKKIRRFSLQSLSDISGFDWEDFQKENKEHNPQSPKRRERRNSVATPSRSKLTPVRSTSPVGRFHSTAKLNCPGSISIRRQTSSHSPKHSVSEGRKKSPFRRDSTQTSNNPPWNPSTKFTTTYPASPRKTVKSKKSPNEASKSIRITTEINRRKNIKFPDGKTVDKETKTTTTVSVDVDSEEEKMNQRNSLLNKVKTLAHEIENLSKDSRLSDSSSDSIVSQPIPYRSNSIRAGSDILSNAINEETDRFSETEYLSFISKN